MFRKSHMAHSSHLPSPSYNGRMPLGYSFSLASLYRIRNREYRSRKWISLPEMDTVAGNECRRRNSMLPVSDVVAVPRSVLRVRTPPPELDILTAIVFRRLSVQVSVISLLTQNVLTVCDRYCF